MVFMHIVTLVRLYLYNVSLTKWFNAHCHRYWNVHFHTFSKTINSKYTHHSECNFLLNSASSWTLIYSYRTLISWFCLKFLQHILRTLSSERTLVISPESFYICTVYPLIGLIRPGLGVYTAYLHTYVVHKLIWNLILSNKRRPKPPAHPRNLVFWESQRLMNKEEKRATAGLGPKDPTKDNRPASGNWTRDSVANSPFDRQPEVVSGHLPLPHVHGQVGHH